MREELRETEEISWSLGESCWRERRGRFEVEARKARFAVERGRQRREDVLERKVSGFILFGE